MGRLVIAAVATAILLALGAAAALANDSAVGGVGGAVYPVGSADIRMDSEAVQAICYRGFAEYRVDFRFVNEGEAQRVWLGFPFAQLARGDEGDTYPPVAFQAWQEGQPLAVTIAQGKDGPDYFLHRALMEQGTTMIRVGYLADSSGASVGRRLKGASDVAASTAEAYDYWLHTGWMWKGRIGRAVVRFTLADTFGGTGVDLGREDFKDSGPESDPTRWVTRPAGYTRPSPNVYQWSYEDFEPRPAKPSDPWSRAGAYDVTLAFTPGPGDPWHGNAKASSTSRRKRGNGQLAFDEFDRSNVLDGFLASAWAEGAPGDGEGEWLHIPVNGTREVRELRIVPGNQREPADFKRYGRPRELRVALSDGTEKVVRLSDSPSVQRFPISGQAKWARLTIVSAYPGSAVADTAIAEVELGSERAPAFADFADLVGLSKLEGGDTDQSDSATGSSDATAAGGSAEATGVGGSSGTGTPGRRFCLGAAWLGVLAVGLLCYTPALRRRAGR